MSDDLIEQKKDQEGKQKEIQRSSSSSPPPSSYSSSSTFEEIKQIRPKISTSNGPFNNLFSKKNRTNSVNETSITDELSKWKPSINKSRLVSSNKTRVQVEIDLNIFVLI